MPLPGRNVFVCLCVYELGLYTFLFDWLRAVLDLWHSCMETNRKHPLLHCAPTFSHCGEISRTIPEPGRNNI